MRDLTNNLAKISTCHPAIRDEIPSEIDEAEAILGPRIAIRITQAYRSIDYQNSLYAQGRTKPGSIVTKAKGGTSYHNYALAIDFCLLYDKDNNGTFEVVSWDVAEDFNKDGKPDWTEVINIFKSHGWEWGGDWIHIHDAPHFEKRFGHLEDCSDLLIKYNKKDFIPGTQYINL